VGQGNGRWQYWLGEIHWMKTFIASLIVVIAGHAMAAAPPILRNAYTTNQTDECNLGTIAAAQTATFSQSTNVYRAIFSGSTFNLNLPASPHSGGQVLILGTNTSGGTQIGTIQVATVTTALYRDQINLLVSTITNNSGAAFAIQFRASNGSWSRVYAIGDTPLTDGWSLTGTNTYTTGNAGIGTLPVSNNRLTIESDNLGGTLLTSPTNGIFLLNTTPATIGAQQYSPGVFFSGGAFATTPSSNTPIVFKLYNATTQGSTVGSGTLFADVSVNNGAYVNVFGAASSGIFSAGQFISAGNITAGQGSTYIISGRSRIGSSVDGALEFSNNGLTSRATAQFNIPQLIKTTNYQALATDSGLFFNNVGASAARTNWLPSAVAGMHFSFDVDAAQIVSIKPFTNATDVIRWGSILGTTNDDIWSSQVGSRVHLNCVKAGLWVVDRHEGAWTFVAPRVGNAVLVGGTVTVNNSTVTANSVVLLTRKTSGGTPGTAVTYTTSAGTSFTITSDNALDTSTFSWKLEEIPN